MIPGRPVTRRAELERAVDRLGARVQEHHRVERLGERRREVASASREIGSVKPIALIGPISLSTWAWIAAVTRGWAWPSAVTAIPFAKSR